VFLVCLRLEKLDHANNTLFGGQSGPPLQTQACHSFVKNAVVFDQWVENSYS
jgi:hypothetical protein